MPDNVSAEVVSLASQFRGVAAQSRKRAHGTSARPGSVSALLKRQRGEGVGTGVARPSVDEFAEACVDSAFDDGALVLTGSPSWFKAPALIAAARRGAVTSTSSHGVSVGSAVALNVVEADKLRAARRERAAQAAERRFDGVRDVRALMRGAGPSRSGRLALDVLARRADVERARVAQVERIAQLKSEYGAARVGSLLAVGDSHGITVDLDVLESALAVVDLDLNVERAVEQSGVDAQATRWGRALESLPRFLFEAVLQALRSEYGVRAQDILVAPWSQDWEQWDHLVASVQSAVAVRGDACLIEEDVLELVRKVLRAHVRLSVSNAAVVFPTDAEKLRELVGVGLNCGRGEIFRDANGDPANQCLADSLLQLLIHHGLLSSDIGEGDRREACAENRRMFVASDGPLQPRDRDAFSGQDAGVNPQAFLQHDVHAAPSVCFFMEWFRSRGLSVRELPAAGIVLTVHSRFDSADLPPDRHEICVGVGRGVGGVLLFDLYNSTGTGVSGAHYDPLFPNSILVD